jgi:hypothetical protein
MQQHFIPNDATGADLERKAADAEEKASNESEPLAAEFREEAKLLLVERFLHCCSLCGANVTR